MMVIGSRKSTVAILASLGSSHAWRHLVKSSTTLRILFRRSDVRLSLSGDAYES
jgi:hypothetical protein